MSSSPLPFMFELSEEDLEHVKAQLPCILERYKDQLATLPKEKGWWTESQYMYQGFWHKSKLMYSFETTMALQDTYQARPSDIYLATLPKSGTTWMKALMFAVVNRTMYKSSPLSAHPLLKYTPHIIVPSIETEFYRKTPTYVDGHSPRLFATHLPYTSLPKSIIDSGCSIVYMSRNPKDVLVSLFHFSNKLRGESRGLMKFEEAFELFIKGVTDYGPYSDHVKEYYNASLQHPTKTLFLTYESMSLDTTNNVKHLAEFLGYPFTKEEEAEGAVEEIVRLCSFKTLSEANKHGDIIPGMPKSIHFREGKVGGWNNHLTTEMSQKLDQITKEKFHGLNISF